MFTILAKASSERPRRRGLVRIRAKVLVDLGQPEGDSRGRMEFIISASIVGGCDLTESVVDFGVHTRDLNWHHNRMYLGIENATSHDFG